MRKLCCAVLAITLLLSLTGCGGKILHCDKCGAEVKAGSSSKMEEDWSVYCEECNEKYFG